MKTCPVCDTPYPDQHRNCPTDGAVLLESLEFEPGHILRGKYRLLRKLGQGGMGVVYLAEHLMLGGKVALKFLASELSRNPQFVKRFRNEARAAYQLRHPNIVEVTDLDQGEDGSLFIAMEYVAGPSLRSVLQESNGPFSVNRTLEIARGMAAGLAAAHARGAVHRDIKPENILIAADPNGEIRPKILDFGIAAMNESITSLSRTHGLLLTPEYAVPEQWRGTPANELDGRTDLYALGCVLYEMLAGRKPFQASTPEGWMFQHLQAVPQPLGSLRPDLVRDHPQLEASVMRLLARERDQRFSSAAELLKVLTVNPFEPTESLSTPSRTQSMDAVTYLESAPVDAKAAEPPAQVAHELFRSVSIAEPRPGRRRIAWIAPAVVVVVAALCFAVWSASGDRSGKHPQPPAQAAMNSGDAHQPSESGGVVAPDNRNTDTNPATRDSRSGMDLRKSQNSPAPHRLTRGEGTAGEAREKNGNPQPGGAAGNNSALQNTNPLPPPSPATQISSGVALGMLLEKTTPVYPPIAKAARVSGTVVLKATISEEGTIEDLRVVSGPAMLQQASIDAVKTWRYRPYLLYGKPVKVETTVNVIFALGQ